MSYKTRFSFNTIGGGRVLAKYFLPVLMKDKKYNLNLVMTRSEKAQFYKFLRECRYSQNYKNFPIEKINHAKTNGEAHEVCEILTNLCPLKEPVMVLTPPQSHLKMVTELLHTTKRKIYLDKPAVSNFSEFKSLNQLMIKYTNRLYLAEQYLYGRSPIFCKLFNKHRQALGKILKAELFLEEGARYFNDSQEWSATVKEKDQRFFDYTGSWFADVGPELDLSVHLLATLFNILGQKPTYKIISARLPNNYLENYGVESELMVGSSFHPEFKVILKCGKRNGKNDRYFRIICENGEITQRYTSQNCTDPVYLKLKGKRKLVGQNPKNRQYFDSQLQDFAHWVDRPHDQMSVVKALECALNIKEQRVNSTQLGDSEKIGKIVAMIPARMENKYLKKKHIREMAGKPMIYYAVNAALNSGIFDKVYVNSESALIGSIGKKLGASFYERDPDLAKETVNNEEFVFDFLKNIECEYLFMINPNKPLISTEEIKAFVQEMVKGKLDVMFSTEEIHTQVCFEDRPVNFSVNKPHLRSWQIKPVQAIQWTITGWKAETFLRNYRKNKCAIYSGKMGLFPVSEDANFSVKKERDFAIAEKILRLSPKTTLS